MSEKLSYELIEKLPKSELHCHLDGSLRVSTIIDLAKDQDVKLPYEDEDKLRDYLTVNDNNPSLLEYLKGFEITTSVLQSYDSLERTAYELAIDSSKENIRYLEVRFSPILHVNRGLKLTEVTDAVLKGLKRAENEVNIKTGLIICAMRSQPPRNSIRLAELAVAFKNRGVVGFDLAGDEANYPAKTHSEAFELILKNNVNCTLHAGEAYGPISIHQAIHDCGAHRIGHGVRLREDGDLLNYVNDHRIPLELCITSNVQTKSVKSLKEHPILFYYDYGLRITINTDNRLMSNTNTSKELYLAAKYFDFDLTDIGNIIINGFKSAFINYADKKQILGNALKELRELGYDSDYLKYSSQVC
ncbi:MAG: adenosine deaminase [Candidatus Zixiibacteriota bacterium]